MRRKCKHITKGKGGASHGGREKGWEIPTQTAFAAGEEENALDKKGEPLTGHDSFLGFFWVAKENVVLSRGHEKCYLSRFTETPGAV